MRPTSLYVISDGGSSPELRESINLNGNWYNYVFKNFVENSKMYDQDNIFRKIINGDAPCDKIYEDDKVLAFKNLHPEAAIHVLVITKGEFISLVDFTTNNTQEEIGYFFKKVNEVARSLKLEEDGFRIVTNHGKNANQTVKHFHVHILGGEKIDKY